MFKWMFNSLGLACITIGLVAIIQSANQLSRAEMDALRGPRITDSPTEPIAGMRCPLDRADNKPGEVRLTITNTFDTPTTYHIQFTGNQFPASSQGAPQLVTVAAKQTKTVNVTPDNSYLQSPYFRVVHVFVYADRDLALPGPFHMWPASFTGTCTVRMVNSPEFLAVQLATAIGVAAFFVGSVLTYFANRPVRTGNIGIITVYAAFAALSIIAPY